EALPHLKKAQTLNPDHVGTYVQLGRLYLARKNYSDAKIALEEAIQINPFNPKIYHFLRQIYTALGEQDQANKSGETLKRLMTSK
ncbi:MAG: tetratricopeptide repeat protein, partial [Candidatus Binatia bacterium]